MSKQIVWEMFEFNMFYDKHKRWWEVKGWQIVIGSL